jgi:hypothetical protein
VTVLLQPPGSTLCTWYSVMNAHIKAGLEPPTLDHLMSMVEEKWRDNGLHSYDKSRVLGQLGWRAVALQLFRPNTMRGVLPPLLETGGIAFISHDHWTGGKGMAHAVVVDSIDAGGLNLLCSHAGHHRIPWDMAEPDQPGIQWHAVIAWPPSRK